MPVSSTTSETEILTAGNVIVSAKHGWNLRDERTTFKAETPTAPRRRVVRAVRTRQSAFPFDVSAVSACTRDPLESPVLQRPRIGNSIYGWAGIFSDGTAYECHLIVWHF